MLQNHCHVMRSLHQAVCIITSSGQFSQRYLTFSTLRNQHHKIVMEENNLLNCTFWVDFDDRNVCFRIKRIEDNQRTFASFSSGRWKVILPVQSQQDTSRFKWALGYHSLEHKFKNVEKHTVHQLDPITDNYNRGFLVRSDIFPLFRKTIGSSQPDLDSKSIKLRNSSNEWYDTFEIVSEDTGTSIERNREVIGGLQLEAETNVHPAFQSRQNNSLFHCLADAVDIHLKDERVIAIPGVSDLAEIVNASRLQRKVYTPERNPQDPFTEALRKPFIVIEGLDATGKSTLVKKLADKIGAEMMCTPPSVIQHLRSRFDSAEVHSTLMRRVFYAIGNYITAKNIEHALHHKPVVMDRYWHSTAAYTIATECGSGDQSSLPPEGHWAYEWPVDLLVPDLVILLTVSDEIRDQRMSQRNTEETVEERRLAENVNFRKRIIGAYRRMIGPVVVEIDASGNKEKVQETVLTTVRDRGLLD